MAEPAEAKGDPPITILDKRGDVVLFLGNNEPSCKLLVSSRVLSLASHVFEAMFNHGFSEGKDLSTTTSKEIPLPDDDPAITLVLCSILHFQSSNIPTEATPRFLANFAVLCDKYNCTSAVSSWTQLWTKDLLLKPMTDDFERLLFATYLLDMPEAFSKVTESLIRYHTFRVDFEAATHGFDIIPLKVFTRIEQAQRYFHDQMMKSFDCDMAKRLRCFDDCPRLGWLASTFLSLLPIHELWPPRSLTLQIIRLKMQDMPEEMQVRCGCSTCLSVSRGIKPAILTEMDAALAAITGLCLDCLKGHGGYCRLPHAPPLY